MPECVMEIRGCRSGYRPGETIQGEVVVTVTEPIECRSLTITTSYRASGAGNSFESQPRALQLFAGRWQQGEHCYPFELPAPAGPASYRGRRLEVTHWLFAHSDLAWAKDPAAVERRFGVSAEDVARYDDGPGWSGFVVDGLPTPDAADQTPRGWIVPSGLGCISSVGWLFLLLGLMEARQLSLQLAFFLSIPLLIALGPIYLAFRMYRPGFVARRIGRPELLLDRATVRAGESTQLRVRYCAPRRVALSGAAVEIECTETKFVGSGKSARLDRGAVHHEGFTLDIPERIAAGETVERVMTLPIPRDAPPTFVAPGASVTWKVSVRVMAGRRRFATSVLPLIVRPPKPSVSPGTPA